MRTRASLLPRKPGAGLRVTAVAAAVALFAAVGGAAQVSNAAAAGVRSAAAAHTTTPRAIHPTAAELQSALSASTPATAASEVPVLGNRFRLMSADIPANGGCEALYYGPGLCMGLSTDIPADIIAVGSTIINVIIAIILARKGGSGKDKDDPEVKLTSTGPFYTGDCVSVYGTQPTFQSCSPEASKWIEVPTGGSYALENAYWYDQNVTVNHHFLTAPSDSAYGVLYLHNAINESEDLRTWWFPGSCCAVTSPPAA